MRFRYLVHWLQGVLLVGLFYSSGAMSETIAMIGTGNVGRALGPEFAALGHEVIYGSRNRTARKLGSWLAKPEAMHLRPVRPRQQPGRTW